jgi:hypothetical protein
MQTRLRTERMGNSGWIYNIDTHFSYRQHTDVTQGLASYRVGIRVSNSLFLTPYNE